MTAIIGREAEKKILDNIWSSKEAEFMAIYGRRRVGKTFLVREFFSKKGLYFELAGIKDGTLSEQLANFSESFTACFYPGLPMKAFESWREAFGFLTKEIEKQPKSKKITIFLDELPWLASKRSQLLQNLDYFWNTKWSQMPQIKLVVCGSAASWMIEHLINAKGGLHNRLTKTMLLEPFDLANTKHFLESRGIKINNKQILDIYMAMGGIPHYLKQIEKSKSAIQNINDICFKKNGLLFDEFPRLFKSLFQSSEINLKIFKEISKYPSGISRDNLLKKAGLTSGGTFNLRLFELESAGFIQGFFPYGKKKYHFYRSIDQYSNFYIRWIDGQQKSTNWENKLKTPEYLSWAGYAFEGICLKHVDWIKKSLGLDKIASEIASFREISKRRQTAQGAQIDLLFDRADDSISLCEIKYSSSEFVIDKSYARNLANKIDVFQQVTHTKKQIFLVFIGAYGLKKNLWSEDLVAQSVSILELF